jgi:hypothetical protein
MKILLHIGGIKTGTSSIQECLLQNKHVMAKKGYFYLHMNGRNEYRDLPAYCSRQDKYDHYFESISVNNSLTREKFDENFLAVFQHKMESIPPNTHTVIISSEHLSFQLQHQDEVDRVKQLLTTYSQSIEICYYIREQSDMVVSAYSTRIKTGYAPTFDEFFQMYIANPANDYDLILKLWERAFGQRNVILRLYDNNELIGSDVIKDFLHHLDENLYSNLNTTMPQHNRSLSRTGVFFSRLINKLIPNSSKKKYVRNLNRAFLEIISKYVGGQKVKPEQHHIDKIREEFASSNERVRARYFSGRKALFGEN